MALISNKKASFNYEISDKCTAGMELFGFEVKSLKKSQGSLEAAHVTVRGGEAYIVGMFIPPYQVGNTPNEYDPYRNRRLLLKKAEILKLSSIEETKGLTIVPLTLYNKNGLLKIDLAVGRGKKKFDKRESIKKQDTERQNRREFVDR